MSLKQYSLFHPVILPMASQKIKNRNYHSVVFISYFKIINFKIELFTKINHKNFSPHQCLYLHESPHIRSHNGQSLTWGSAEFFLSWLTRIKITEAQLASIWSGQNRITEVLCNFITSMVTILLLDALIALSLMIMIAVSFLDLPPQGHGDPPFNQISE